MSATLAQLLSVQSRLAQDATSFLEGLAKAVDTTPWEFDGKPLRASDAFVEPVVFTAREPQRERDEGPERKARDSGKELSPTDALMQKFYERERQAGKNEEKRWQQVVRHGGTLRVIAIGEPGGGKTCATRFTVAELAQGSATALREHMADVSEVPLPFWITAQRLAEQSAPDLADAVLGALDDDPTMRGVIPAPLRPWLRAQVLSERAFIVVDALDELREQDHADAFAQRLGELGRSAASLVVTCRTLPWARLKEHVPWQTARAIVEFKPVDDRRQRDYAERFFTFLGRPEHSSALVDRIQRHLPLREHCRTPLILTFACGLLAAPRGEKLPVNAAIAVLYRLVVRALLEGRWRKPEARPTWSGEKDERAEILDFLPALAWRLFEESPSTNRFDLRSWKAAYDFAKRQSGALFLDQRELRKDLVRVGLLVDGGTDEAGNECWSFAHRTVLEFLAAEGLNRDTEKLRWLLKEQKRIEDNPFWFKQEWLPTLTFLAAIMGDATSLIEATDIPPLIDGKPAPGDDFFRQMFGLKCRFAGAAPNTPESLLQSLSNTWFHEWSASSTGTLEKNVLVEYGRAIAESSGFVGFALQKLIDRLLGDWTDYSDQQWQEYVAIVHALGSLGNRLATDALLATLENPKMLLVTGDICNALATLGDSASLAPLLRRFTHEKSWPECQALIGALGVLGGRTVIEPLMVRLAFEEEVLISERLLETLRDLGVRLDIERAVGLIDSILNDSYPPSILATIDLVTALADEKAIPFLATRLQREHQPELRRNIIRALGKIGGPLAKEVVLSSFLHEQGNTNTVVSAIDALVDLMAGEAVPLMLKRLWEKPDKEIRLHLVDALGALGDATALQPLIDSLSHEEDIYVRWHTIGSLGAFKDTSVVEIILHHIKSIGVVVDFTQGRMTRALKNLKPTEAAPRLISMLKEPENEIEYWNDSPESSRDGLVWFICDALGSLAGGESVKELLGILYSERSCAARKGVVTALRKISQKERVFIPALSRQ